MKWSASAPPRTFPPTRLLAKGVPYQLVETPASGLAVDVARDGPEP
jgi:hypothetical protein